MATASQPELTVRKSGDRGTAEHGWLSSKHTFSFGGYYDPDHTGFRSLLVINEDRVDPGAGFREHPHDNMEIISYVVSGALAHKDSTGTQSTIHDGDFQKMTAGTGVRHSEFNGSRTNEVHFLQIWITPSQRGLQPSYEEKNFSDVRAPGKLTLVGSPDGRDGSLTIHQDVSLYAGDLDGKSAINHQVRPDRGLWVQVVRGNLSVNGMDLSEGDGLRIEHVESLTFTSDGPAEFLLFDLE